KAQLRQSPATYKIPAQKTEDGKSIEEGTLVYDTTANVLNICLGCTYDEVEPNTPFTIATETESTETSDATAKAKTTKKKSASKAKVWNYTGAKVIVEEQPTMEEASPQGVQEEQKMQEEKKEENKEVIKEEVKEEVEN